MNTVKNIITNNLNDIHGWCPVEKAHYLIDLVQQCQAKAFVELGVFGGRSLLPVALAMKNLGNDEFIIGVDSWTVTPCLEGNNDAANNDWWSAINYDNMYSYTIDLMKKYNLENSVKLYRTTSAQYAKYLGDNCLDMLHQDSNHSTEVTCNEVELYCKKVKVGGLWVFDDTDWPTTQQAQINLVAHGYELFYDAVKWKVFRRVK